jgi:hypothetical protein
MDRTGADFDAFGQSIPRPAGRQTDPDAAADRPRGRFRGVVDLLTED